MRMLFDVYQDRVYLISMGKNGKRLIIANSEVEQEWYRVAMSSLLIFLGFISIVTEPPTTIPVLLPSFIETNVSILRIGLICATCLVALKSFRARTTRKKVADYDDDVLDVERRKHDFGPPFAMEERRKNPFSTE